MTTEQKWRKWDVDTFNRLTHGIYDSAEQSREAYKSALRKAIEENYDAMNNYVSRQELIDLLENVNPE
jgi:hypothetical protein